MEAPGRGASSKSAVGVVRRGSWSKSKSETLSGVMRRAGHSSRLVRGLVAALTVCFLLSFTHMAVMRGSMTRKLDMVLSVFERAQYVPTLKGLVLHHDDTAVSHGEDSTAGDGEHRRRHGRSLLPVASALSTVSKAASQCAVTFKMNVTDDAAKTLDLDDFDLELLGTIMVRLCDCKCVGEDQPPMKNAMMLMEEILKGAHVVVEGDRGSFYSWFVHIQDSYRRPSSHYSIVPMYGVPEGSVLRTMLTGRDVNGDSWFQFENANWAPLSHPVESAVHAVNYIQYKLSGAQVGPLGQSSHTDRRPIRLRFDGCVDPRRKLFRQYDPDDDTGKTRRITFLRASKQQGSRR